MDRVPYASANLLRAIVARFDAVEWPIERSRLSEIASELDWTVQVEVPKGVYFRTGDPLDTARAEALVSDGVIGQVTIDVSGRVGEGDATAREELAVAFAAVRQSLEEILGDPAVSRGGQHPRVAWELHNGGRVALSRLEAVVRLVVLQRTFADIERFEESRGISADRDPLAE